jgi:predicted permease
MPLSLGGGSDTSPDIDGYTPQPHEEMTVHYGMVSSDFFSTLRMPIIDGRAIDATDIEPAAPVVVINETMAKKYWAGRRAVGGTVRTGSDAYTVVGVVKDGKYGAINEAPLAVMFFSIQQAYRANPTLIIATNGPGASAAANVRKVISTLAPNLALSDVRTLDEHLAVSTAIPRVGAILLAVFGALALALAAIGLYGVVAFTVSQRTREIGVRLALGADARTILRQIVGEAAWTSGVGVVIGLALAAAAGSAVRSLLINVSPTDALSYALIAAMLLVVTLVASGLPARRASKVDPVNALRME